MATMIVAATCAILVALVTIVLWLKRRRIARHISSLAALLGLNRKRGETDEELRARCRAILTLPQPGSRKSIELATMSALHMRGYTGCAVDVAESAIGVVRVLVTGAPSDVLREVESELRDHLPVWACVEVEAKR